MEFEFSWIEPALILCRTSGQASTEGFAALSEELRSQPNLAPGVKILADHTSLDVSALSAGDIEQIAGMRTVSGSETEMRSALVVGKRSPAKYGLARMFGSYVTSRGDDPVRVFENYDEALAWLQSVGPSSSSGPTGEGATESAAPAK